jgi:hypothetical protein
MRLRMGEGRAPQGCPGASGALAAVVRSSMTGHWETLYSAYLLRERHDA